jgi:riboflavin biosynthesis pyrimidine reductase
MTQDSSPSLLIPLLPPGPNPRVTAAEAVERMRLWDPASGQEAAGNSAADGERPDAPGSRGPAETPAPARPRVFLNMASTADGRAALGGRSGGIGNRADRELFRALRTAVDAVMVGAGTARTERYRGLVRDEERRRLRRARGLSEEPLACIVSAGLALCAAEVPLLADPAARVVVLTPSVDGVVRDAAARGVEYVRAARDGALDLPAALAELRGRWGVRALLCEGGPHLNGELLRAGVVDEVFLSFAPKLGGGDGAQLRIVCGPELDPPVELRLCDALESEGLLLLRYRVSR